MKLELPNQEAFNEEQRNYLDGFFAGIKNRGVGFTGVMADPVVENEKKAKKKVAAEEKIKEALDPLDAFPLLRTDARENRAPEKENIFRYKWNGLFWLAPVVEGYMCRLRIPGGWLKTYQWRELAAIADELASGFGQLTTRNNVQLRVIQPKDTPELIRRVEAVGLKSKGSGADNLRNFTANPTAGICPHELIDVRPFVDDLAAVITGSLEFYDLPRKFNVSFDGGNVVGVAEDTNDIGFRAVRLASGEVVFRILLGGVTGHEEFAEDSGVFCKPEEVVDVCLAMIRVYMANGNRGNRKRARLIYLLKDWGFEKFLAATEEKWGASFGRVAEVELEAVARPEVPHPHLGAHAQAQEGLSYLGVHVPVGVIESDKMRALADVAERFGSGELRLTIFQSVIIPNIATERICEAKAAVREAGLDYQASFVRGGLAACTGNRYCKYSSADTKGHAVALVDSLDAKIELDQPLNIHVTGCPHSCAQHYIGDIGLLACKVERGGEVVEGFHVFVGGGFRDNKRLGRQLLKGLAAGDELEEKVLALLECYLEGREGGETFQEFTARQDIGTLAELIETRTRSKAA